MNLVDRLRLQVEVRRLDVREARKRLAREEGEARKENRQVPKQLREQLQEDIRTANRSVDSCCAALEAACRFPTIGRAA